MKFTNFFLCALWAASAEAIQIRNIELAQETDCSQRQSVFMSTGSVQRVANDYIPQGEMNDLLQGLCGLCNSNFDELINCLRGAGEDEGATCRCLRKECKKEEKKKGGPQGNNGFGNGDQDAPGGSGAHNNAENATGDKKNGGNGNDNEKGGPKGNNGFGNGD